MVVRPSSYVVQFYVIREVTGEKPRKPSYNITTDHRLPKIFRFANSTIIFIRQVIQFWPTLTDALTCKAMSRTKIIDALMYIALIRTIQTTRRLADLIGFRLIRDTARPRIHSTNDCEVKERGLCLALAHNFLFWLK